MKGLKSRTLFWALVAFGVALLILPAGVSIRLHSLHKWIEHSIHYPYWWRRHRWWYRRYYNKKNPIYCIYWRWYMKGTF